MVGETNVYFCSLLNATKIRVKKFFKKVKIHKDKENGKGDNSSQGIFIKCWKVGNK